MSRFLMRCGIVLTLAVLAFSAALRPACALDPWRIVVRVQGLVQTWQPGQAEWDTIFRSRRLDDNGRARTLANSMANINLADQTSFRIGPNSEVEMTKFELTPEGRTVVFTLRAGQIQANVAKFFGKQSRFEVKTPNGVLAARGTAFSVTCIPASDLAPRAGTPAPAAGELVTLVSVYEGTVASKRDQDKDFLLLGPGDNAIVGQGAVIVNPPNFPGQQMMPPTQQNFQSYDFQSAQGVANSFQSESFQSRVDAQYNQQVQQYQGVVGNNTDMHGQTLHYVGVGDAVFGGAVSGDSGGSQGSSPPFFNPTNTVNPLGGGASSGSATPTGRVILIIR